MILVLHLHNHIQPNENLLNQFRYLPLLVRFVVSGAFFKPFVVSWKISIESEKKNFISCHCYKELSSTQFFYFFKVKLLKIQITIDYRPNQISEIIFSWKKMNVKLLIEKQVIPLTIGIKFSFNFVKKCWLGYCLIRCYSSEKKVSYFSGLIYRFLKIS